MVFEVFSNSRFLIRGGAEIIRKTTCGGEEFGSRSQVCLQSRFLVEHSLVIVESSRSNICDIWAGWETGIVDGRIFPETAVIIVVSGERSNAVIA